MCGNIVVFYYDEWRLQRFLQIRVGIEASWDPLSPYLFILMEEVLSRMLKVDFEKGRIRKFVYPKGCPLISHLLYIDDLLVFTNGEHRSLKQLLMTLGFYEWWFKQKINKAMFAFFFSSKINNVRRMGLI